MLTFVPNAPSCQRLHAQMMDVSPSILAWPAPQGEQDAPGWEGVQVLEDPLGACGEGRMRGGGWK